MTNDPRMAAADYSARQADRADAENRETENATHSAPHWTTADRAAVVEQTIQQAIRDGAFDNLPGAGKPLENLGASHDPDWWIRHKIETERLQGLGPAALSLRVESSEFSQRMDALGREADVREAVTDFNARIRYTRMQLQGGPPVVTAMRDVDQEIAAWRERRAQRLVTETTTADTPQKPRRVWRRR